jgi:lauroyl/myristoyl acyltransferase
MKRVRFEGLNQVLSLRDKNEPVVLATLHFGHLRLLRYLLGIAKIDCSMVTLDGAKGNERHLMRDDYFNRGRHARPLPPMRGVDVLGIAETTRDLNKGGTLLIAVDVGRGQQIKSAIPGGAGSFEMAAGAITLARNTGAKLMPCLLYEEKPWRMVVHIGGEIALGDGCNPDNQTAADRLTAAFWPIVSAYPAQYDCGPISFWKSPQIEV